MKITVVAAILKDDNLTLITEQGEYHKLAQGDQRIRPILDQILPVITAGEKIEIDITKIETNAFEDFEKKSGGVIKFFRVAKSALKNWFGAGSLATAPIYNGTYGQLPDTPKEVEEHVKEIQENPEVREKTLAEIVAEAKPVTGLVFNTNNADHELKSDETVIAVVDNNHIIANAENLHAQVAHANRLGDPTAFENFARLVAAVPRQHSMEDLVAFISKLDTPLTEAGYVLAYKNLNSSSEKDVYVDPYTNKVKQSVGTRVCMSPSLVDPDRGQDCSNGLHIASRSYLGGYSGTGGTFLVRIKPSDVIAVPKYNTNKMRVCAYEIMGKLNEEDRQAVCSNRPLATDEGKRLLAAVIAGKGVAITKQTEITAGMGGGCIYTNVNEAGYSEPENAKFEGDTLEDLGMVDPIDPEAAGGFNAPVVNPTEINEAVEEVALTRKELAKRYYDRWSALVLENADDAQVKAAYMQLIAYKKSCKVGWDRLDIPNQNGEPVAVIMKTVTDEGVDYEFKGASSGAEFEAATAQARDSSDDADNLNQYYDDWLMAVSGSKAEYEAAVKLVNLFNIAGFEWDEDGDCPELDFNQFEIDCAESTIRDWERNQLTNQLAPEAPETSNTGDEDEPVGGHGSYRERIRRLLNAGSLTIGTAKDILSIKKSSKKGWSTLGVTAEEAFDIEEQAKTD